MKSPWQFLVKVAVFAVPLVLAAYVLDAVVTNGLRQTRDDRYSVWNDILAGKVNADVLVNGSSRAMVQFSPAILDTCLGVRSYDLGCSGYGFRMQFCRFNAFMEHNPKPGVILQEVDYGTFTSRNTLFETAQFLPYLDDSLIQVTTRKYQGIGFFEYNLPLLRYYGNNGVALVGLYEYFHIRHFKGRRYRGYVPHDLPWNGDLEAAWKEFPEGRWYHQQPELIRLFRAYLERCNREDIKVILVWAPEYAEGKAFIRNRDAVRRMFFELSRDYQLTFLDYSNDAICSNKQFFYNTRHMNKKGAETFTRELANDLIHAGVFETAGSFRTVSARRRE